MWHYTLLSSTTVSMQAHSDAVMTTRDEAGVPVEERAHTDFLIGSFRRLELSPPWDPQYPAMQFGAHTARWYGLAFRNSCLVTIGPGPALAGALKGYVPRVERL
jgi:hypothetical protein